MSCSLHHWAPLFPADNLEVLYPGHQDLQRLEYHIQYVTVGEVHYLLL